MSSDADAETRPLPQTDTIQSHNATPPAWHVMGSEVGADTLWRMALADYAAETGTDLRRHDLTRLVDSQTVDYALAIIDEEMHAFKALEEYYGHWIDLRNLVKDIALSVFILCDSTTPLSSIFSSQRLLDDVSDDSYSCARC